MRKAVFLLLVVLMCVPLAGCDSPIDVNVQIAVFEGSSGPWSARMQGGAVGAFYRVDGTLHYWSKGGGSFVLIYEGDPAELGDVTDFGYSYRLGASNFGLSEHGRTGPLTEHEYRERVSDLRPTELQNYSTVTVTVSVNGQDTTFELEKAGRRN